MLDLYEKCTLCPRECKVNRNNHKTGYCKETAKITIARAALHYWEEPVISGENGSGTIFFSGCTMGCVFCQNHEISNGDAGKAISIERLVEIFFELQDKKAHNINLVTPTHFTASLIEAMSEARRKGLKIPFVYNTSGYEKVSTLKKLDGLVDIYLPDFKYFNDETAIKYSKANNYVSTATSALDEMVRQRNTPQFDSNGLMTGGVIVRHLVLPEHVTESKRLIEYLYNRYHDQIYISIMNQYTPVHNCEKYPEINRKLTQKEYDEVVDYAIDMGVENGFIQEGETASESFIPAFDYEGVDRKL